jgi:hypothetical protein
MSCASDDVSDGLNDRSTVPYCATAVSAADAFIVDKPTRRETKTQAPRKEPESTLMLVCRVTGRER